jgi:hypothetical protein
MNAASAGSKLSDPAMPSIVLTEHDYRNYYAATFFKYKEGT